jgi:hypothetical protein
MSRRRLTWDSDHRRASEHPATPDEGPASPAHKPEPSVDEYGMDSDFGATPNPGPYANGEHPAYPDEGPAHPAHKAAALERKAAKCIRVASAMLGAGAGVEAIEDQALTLMDLSNRALAATLSRLSGEDKKEKEDHDKGAIKDDEDHIEDLEDDEDDDKAALKKEKKASRALAARVARLERVLVRLADSEDPEGGDDDDKGSEDPGEDESSKKADWHPGHTAPGGWDPGSEEMLQEMMKEEGMHHDDPEAMLAEMMEEEGMHHEEASEVVHGQGSETAEEEALSEYEADMIEVNAPDGMDQNDPESFYGDAMSADPMGMMDEEVMEEEQVILAGLYSEEETPKVAAAKTRPQPKRASKGAKTLGGVSKAASSEASDLSQLWESAPDVSKFF